MKKLKCIHPHVLLFFSVISREHFMKKMRERGEREQKRGAEFLMERKTDFNYQFQLNERRFSLLIMRLNFLIGPHLTMFFFQREKKTSKIFHSHFDYTSCLQCRKSKIKAFFPVEIFKIFRVF